MSTTSGSATELHEAAVLLQQQLVYNGQVLDAALDALRAYKDGTQSLAFLRAGVHLAYAVMRMLEKWARTTGEGSYVRKRAKPKRKKPRANGMAFFFSNPPSFPPLTLRELKPVMRMNRVFRTLTLRKRVTMKGRRHEPNTRVT